jgi:hypothetical protein
MLPSILRTNFNFPHVHLDIFIHVDGWKSLKQSLISRLGGVVVSVLATGPKDRDFEPGQGDVFLRAIQTRSTPFFGWEVKPEVPCRKILRLVQDLLKSHGDE